MYEKINERIPNFDLHPVFTIDGTQSWKGYQEISKIINYEMQKYESKCVLVIDSYYHINHKELREYFIDNIKPQLVICTDDLRADDDILHERLDKFITNDRINGVFAIGQIDEYFDSEKIKTAQELIHNTTQGMIVVYGIGAALVTKGDILVYNNITIQRVKDGYLSSLSNWGMNNPHEDPLTKEKIFNFVEAKYFDNHKRHLFNDMDYVIDGDDIDNPVMVTGDDFRKTLNYFASHPFKLEPFFNRGVWGGHWCKDVLKGGLDRENTAWGMTGWMNFQNALAKLGNHEFRIVGRDIVQYKPIEFLGNQNYFWFGYNCPLGCDFLDTWGGGNLSLQVHPDISYAQEEFNFPFGHYESYYMLDTSENSQVYLGIKEGVKKDDLVKAFKDAQITGKFDDEKWINHFPMKNHDHIYIPSGTIHASGKDTLVLEINPIGFQTFKLWDWGRIDADGKPRPINIDHGEKVIQERYQTQFVKDQLISKKAEIARGTGWRKEHSGTMEYELLKVDRYWFNKPIFFETKDHVKLHVLVEGEEAMIVSPNNEFEPIEMHYAEAVFIPASIGQYVIKPKNRSDEYLAVLEIYMDMGNAYQ